MMLVLRLNMYCWRRPEGSDKAEKLLSVSHEKRTVSYNKLALQLYT